MIAALLLVGLGAAGLTQERVPERGQSLDPRAAKARLVLETHCAHCHQRDRLQRPSPAREIGDILDLDRIATDPSLVIPGNADASLLYSLMVRREMPPNHADGANGGDVPTSVEVDALRDWIESLPPSKPHSCSDRARVSMQSVREAASAAIEKAGTVGSDLRFVSLAHLSNLCASDRLLDGYRQALSKLLNGVSKATAPLRPSPVDAAGLILSVRLSELGWTAADWDKLTRHAQLVVPADALAAAVTAPSAYASLLQLAPTLDEQLRALGVERSKADAGRQARRIGLKTSVMTRGHRLIEQWEQPSGSVWVVYDFAGSDGQRDLGTYPLGPLAVPPDATPFKPDAIRLIFSLPNGFLAFAVYDADGKRLEVVPVEVAAPAMAAASERSAVSGCISCHDAGPRKAADEIREGVLAPSSMLPKSVRDAVAVLHPPTMEMDQVLATEGLRYRAALRAAGVDPELRIEGLEPVTALTQAYLRPVTLERLAEDAGEPIERIVRWLEAAGDEAKVFAARLRSGAAVPRGEALRLLGLAMSKGQEPAVVWNGKADLGSLLDLTLLSDKPRYSLGEIATFTIRSSFDCNLTLVSVNAAGKATVVFPNDFEPENALKAGTIMRLPAENAPYRFRLTHPGKQRLIAICTTVSKMADGIRQDYEKQRFTALGDWRNFLRAIVDDETPDISNPERIAETSSKGKAAPVRGKAKEVESPKRSRLEPQARTAIDFTVDDKPR